MMGELKVGNLLKLNVMKWNEELINTIYSWMWSYTSS